MSLATVPAISPPDSHALCRAIAGLPNDDVLAALVKVTGSAGRWSGTAGLAVGMSRTGEVRFPIGGLADVLRPDVMVTVEADFAPADAAAAATFTAEEASRLLVALIRGRTEPPPALSPLTLANGLTIWGRTGSCATHVIGMYATPDLRRSLVFAYRPADPDRIVDEAFGQGIVRAAFDPGAVPAW